MNIKKHELINGWCLQAHSSFEVFSKENKFAVLDWENDLVSVIEIIENVVDFSKCTYNLNPKINFEDKLIIIPGEPEADSNMTLN